MKALWPYVRPVVVVAWVVAAARLVVDATLKPAIFDPLSLASVFYVVPLLLLWIGVSGTWDSLSYGRMLGAFLFIAVACWTIPNSATYTIGQFQGWTHGRFKPPRPEYVSSGERDPEARAAPIAPTAGGKIAAGLIIGGLGTIAGFVWTTAFGSLFVALPARARRRRAASAR